MYVELHTHSYYSLLDGVPSPEELVQRAVELAMPALALTDHDALYGAPRFVQAAQQAGIKPILGAELTLTNGGGCLTLLAENDAGYANLCRLITLARRDQQKGLAALPWRWLADHTQGLIALSGSRRSERHSGERSAEKNLAPRPGKPSGNTCRRPRDATATNSVPGGSPSATPPTWRTGQASLPSIWRKSRAKCAAAW